MSAKIGIIDYQMGNLRSVQKAFESCGCPAEIFSSPTQFGDYDKIILPGVGAVRDAISELKKRGLDQPIIDWIGEDKPFLGICLGLQLLFERCFEGGEHQGLGIIEGDVVQFDIDPALKVPHMGWNQVTRSKHFDRFDCIKDQTYFYFVHSYYVRPKDPTCVALTANYGIDFCAAVCKGNLLATQFHPEKSQSSGLELLKQFANTSPINLRSESPV